MFSACVFHLCDHDNMQLPDYNFTSVTDEKNAFSLTLPNTATLAILVFSCSNTRLTNKG